MKGVGFARIVVGLALGSAVVGSRAEAAVIGASYVVANLSERTAYHLDDQGRVRLSDQTPPVYVQERFGRAHLGTGSYESFGPAAGSITPWSAAEPTASFLAGPGGGSGRVDYAPGSLAPTVDAGGGPRAIGSLGDGETVALGINSGGVVVGWSRPSAESSEVRAFLYDGAIRDLGLGAARANAINDAGVVVGSRELPFGASPFFSSHAFMLKDGAAIDLNDLLPAGSGWVLEAATGVNNLGQIVGVGTLAGRRQSFLLTPSELGAPPDAAPVPEPSTLACAALLVAAGACAARRRTQAA